MSILVSVNTNAPLRLTDFFAADLPHPVTLVYYVKVPITQTAGTRGYTPIRAADLDNSDFYEAEFRQGTTNRSFVIRSSAGGSSVSATLQLGADLENQWRGYVGVFASGGSRTVYSKDGAGTLVSSTNTFTRSPAGVRDLELMVGAWEDGDVRVAYIGLYQSALTSAQAGEFIDTGEVAGLTPYAKWDVTADWGAGQIQDVSGNNRHITAPAGWSYSPDNPTIAAAGPSITSVSTDDIFQDGDTAITVSMTGADTITSAIIRGTDGTTTYNSDVTASFTAQDASNATFTHTRGSTPLTSASWSLELVLSDGTTTVTHPVTINPATGFQVTELAGTLDLAEPNSVFAPYIGPDPVVKDQYIVPLTTTEGAPITANADSTLVYDYSGFGTVPDTDSHSAEAWSSDGTSRIWTSYTISIAEPATDSGWPFPIDTPSIPLTCEWGGRHPKTGARVRLFKGNS